MLWVVGLGLVSYLWLSLFRFLRFAKFHQFRLVQHWVFCSTCHRVCYYCLALLLSSWYSSLARFSHRWTRARLCGPWCHANTRSHWLGSMIWSLNTSWYWLHRWFRRCWSCSEVNHSNQLAVVSTGYFIAWLGKIQLHSTQSCSMTILSWRDVSWRLLVVPRSDRWRPYCGLRLSTSEGADLMLYQCGICSLKVAFGVQMAFQN